MFYFIYSFLFFIAGFFFCLQENPKKVNFIFFYLAVVLFWGLSYYDAADTIGYIDKYNYDIQTLNGYIDRQFEIGYTLLAMLFKTFHLRYWVFQFVVFSVEIWLIVKGLQYFYDNRTMLFFLPLLFFIYPTSLAAFRQGIAISIFIYALHYINDNNHLKSLRYFLFIIIASLFHQSVFLLFVFYFTRWAKDFILKDKILFFALFIGDIIWLFGGNLITEFDFLIPFFRGETLDMGWKYADMLEIESMGKYGFAKILEMNMTVILYILYCKKDKGVGIMRFSMMMYVLIGLVLTGIIAHRLNYYWTILYYICFIRGTMSFFSRYEHSRLAYLIIGAYMFWFYIYKSGYIGHDYVLLFNF